MLEALVCLLLISIMSTISLGLFRAKDYSHLQFANKYLKVQAESFANKQRGNLDYGVSFNSMGHVNKGRTVVFDNRKVIIHLGNGFITIE